MSIPGLWSGARCGHPLNMTNEIFLEIVLRSNLQCHEFPNLGARAKRKGKMGECQGLGTGVSACLSAHLEFNNLYPVSDDGWLVSFIQSSLEHFSCIVMKIV